MAPYLGLLATTIVFGLATRRAPTMFPEFIAQFGGDAVWAAMVLWLLALLHRAGATHHLALGAVVIAFGVELSQLYRAPWIDAVRATTAGALVLGQGFLWSDLASYLVGAMLAASLDAVIIQRLRP